MNANHKYILCVMTLLVLTTLSVVSFQSSEAADAKKVELKILNWEQTQKLIAAHKGKIVVLDAWSTSCDPCIAEFPGLVKLHKKYGGKDVACMSISCDYAGIKGKPPEFYRPRVEKFLTQQEATFENVLCSEEADAIYEKWDLSSVPAVFVYGRDGKLAKRFDNEKAKSEEDGFTYADVTKYVEELLKKKS